MKPTFALTALLIAMAPVALASQPSGGNAQDSQSFNTTLPATGIDRVKLEVKVGQITINASAADTVGIKAMVSSSESMHFIFDWTTGSGAGKLPTGLHLVTHREGNTLVVGLATKNGKLSVDASSSASASTGDGVNININDRSNPGWKSDWTVTLPARLALDLVVGVGKAQINGIAGGLKARLGVGKLDAQLPSGPIDANVGVGNLTASVLSDDYGSVSLRAGVGHVEFDVRGEQNENGYKKEFTSARQSLTGPGKTTYKLTAGVGHVELNVGAKSLKPTHSSDMNTDDGDQ